MMYAVLVWFSRAQAQRFLALAAAGV